MNALPKKLLPLTLFAIAVTSLFSIRPAQANYIVTGFSNFCDVYQGTITGPKSFGTGTRTGFVKGAVVIVW